MGVNRRVRGEEKRLCKKESEEIVNCFGRTWKLYCFRFGLTNSMLFLK